MVRSNGEMRCVEGAFLLGVFASFFFNPKPLDSDPFNCMRLENAR